MLKTAKYAMNGLILGAAMGCCFSLWGSICADSYNVIHLSNIAGFFAALGFYIGLSCRLFAWTGESNS